jgi:haloalkane dehalogenase
MVLDKNVFIKRILPGSVLRRLTDAETAEERRPFEQRADRYPTLTWPRLIPIGGAPTEVVARVKTHGDWLSATETPQAVYKRRLRRDPDRATA